MADFTLASHNWAIIDKFEYWSSSDTTQTRAICVYKHSPFTIRCNLYLKTAVARVTVIVRGHNLH